MIHDYRVDKLVTAEELAACLRVKRKTVYGWVHRREVPFTKMGRRIYIPLDYIEARLRDNAVDDAPKLKMAKPSHDHFCDKRLDGGAYKSKRYTSYYGLKLHKDWRQPLPVDEVIARDEEELATAYPEITDADLVVNARVKEVHLTVMERKVMTFIWNDPKTVDDVRAHLWPFIDNCSMRAAATGILKALARYGLATEAAGYWCKSEHAIILDDKAE